MREDSSSGWRHVAELSRGCAFYVEFVIAVEEPVGLECYVGVSHRGEPLCDSATWPAISFSVSDGWALKESAVGLMRLERLSEVEDPAMLEAAGVFIDAKGDVAFYRKCKGGKWECSRLLERVTSPSSVVIWSEGATCSPIINARKEVDSRPPELPKELTQVHWKSTPPIPWFVGHVRKTDLPALQAALHAGANVGAKDAKHNRALHYCAWRDWVNGARAFLNHGADPNGLNVYNRTPLHEAAILDCAGIAEALIEAAADVDFCGGRSWGRVGCSFAKKTELRSALHYAIINESRGVLQSLLAAAAAIDVEDADGKTPLAIVAEAGDSEATRLLLAARASPDGSRTGSAKCTPLQLAARRGLTEVAFALLAANADANYCVQSDGTITKGLGDLAPLHLVARGRSTGHVQIARALLEARADPQKKSGVGRSARELATINRAPVELLNLLGAKESPTEVITAKQSRTPLQPQYSDLTQEQLDALMID